MTLTEEEAKEHWCPFGRVSEYGYGTASPLCTAVNRCRDGSMTRCMASKCMAWKWAYYPDSVSDTAIFGKGVPGLPGLDESDDPDTWYTCEIMKKNKSPKRGFCGLTQSSDRSRKPA